MSSFSFDTNILVYAADMSDPLKQQTADLVVEAVSAKAFPIAQQCLTEFYAATTRKKRMPALMAENIVRRFLMLPNVAAPEPEDVVSAMSLHRSHGLPFFDALLLATVARSGCSTLFSEDFQHGRSFSSLTVLNPFLLSSSELAAHLA